MMYWNTIYTCATAFISAKYSTVCMAAASLSLSLAASLAMSRAVSLVSLSLSLSSEDCRLSSLRPEGVRIRAGRGTEAEGDMR